MYYDLNFDDWTFEIDKTESKTIVDALQMIWNDYPQAKKKLKFSMKKVKKFINKERQ